MNDKIFGNTISASVLRKAAKKKQSYAHKFPPQGELVLGLAPNGVLGDAFGVQNLVASKSSAPLDLEKGVIVGNIRMGFGHYRIAMAIASAARSQGLTPYWLDFIALNETTGGQVISHLNGLYSLGSRLSQKWELFNRFYWEPLNSEGFKKITFNATDQKVAELFAPICASLPANMPFFGTHVWPAQAAVHAKLKNVLNIVPDNWPMALHLAEGALHLVQSPSAYLGYRTLRGMGNKPDEILHPMPPADLACAGHFVDHEIVLNIERDVEARLQRIASGAPRRILLTVGGAGAQQEFFAGLLRSILPWVQENKVALLINFGDHQLMWEKLCKDVLALEEQTQFHFNNWGEARSFAQNILENPLSGVHAFANTDIFAAVYLTNLLMRAADVIVTKPSELAFYPVPKLFIKRVGGHEAWGAIRGAELGDGSLECGSLPYAVQVLELMIKNDDLLTLQCEHILKAKTVGVYNGAYEAIRLGEARRTTIL